MFGFPLLCPLQGAMQSKLMGCPIWSHGMYHYKDHGASPLVLCYY